MVIIKDPPIKLTNKNVNHLYVLFERTCCVYHCHIMMKLAARSISCFYFILIFFIYFWRQNNWKKCTQITTKNNNVDKVGIFYIEAWGN